MSEADEARQVATDANYFVQFCVEVLRILILSPTLIYQNPQHPNTPRQALPALCPTRATRVQRARKRGGLRRAHEDDARVEQGRGPCRGGARDEREGVACGLAGRAAVRAG